MSATQRHDHDHTIEPGEINRRGCPACEAALRRRNPQAPACDRCSQGVMDSTNPHLLGTCSCECHRDV